MSTLSKAQQQKHSNDKYELVAASQTGAHSGREEEIIEMSTQMGVDEMNSGCLDAVSKLISSIECTTVQEAEAIVAKLGGGSPSSPELLTAALTVALISRSPKGSSLRCHPAVFSMKIDHFQLLVGSNCKRIPASDGFEFNDCCFEFEIRLIGSHLWALVEMKDPPAKKDDGLAAEVAVRVLNWRDTEKCLHDGPVHHVFCVDAPRCAFKNIRLEEAAKCVGEDGALTIQISSLKFV